MEPTPQRAPAVSLIVPVWGDDALVEGLVSGAGEPRAEVEWVVAAVGPGEALRRMERAGRIRLVDCPAPSRGAQMNAGAEVAAGDILCFHHADTALGPEHLAALRDIAADPGVAGGAFHRRFDGRHRWMLRWEKVVHRFDRGLGPFFGDQSIFVRAAVFRAMGGFADIPLMEDLDFSRRLRRAGRVRLLRPPIWSSPRRFRRIGSWRTTLFNAVLIALFYAGVSPERLHRWYYGGKQPAGPARE